MKKKIFGIKISSILTAFLCIVIAFLIWMLVKYNLSGEDVALACHSFIS